jgi:thioredoxin-like negative regulator of GroEL
LWLAVSALWFAACGGAGGLREGTPATDPVSEVPAEQLFETGMASAAQGDFVRAEQYLAASGARGKPETEVIGPLVRVCVAASRLRQALVYAQPYLRRHPDDWRLRFVVATVHLGLEQLDEARTELQRVIAAAPEVPEPYFVLGTLLRERQRDEAAARPHFERYLALAPTGAHADEARLALTTPLPPIPQPERVVELAPPPGTPIAVPAPAPTHTTGTP